MMYINEFQNIRPVYTSDVSDLYVQNLMFSAYRGNTDNVSFDVNENAVFALYNPPDSNVNLFQDGVYYNNFSNYALNGKIYLYATPKGHLKRSPYISNSNTSRGENIESRGRLYSGKNICLAGEYYRDIIISPLSTTRANNNGAVLIAPGMCYLLEVSCLEKARESIVVGFGTNWWEEPVKHFCN